MIAKPRVSETLACTILRTVGDPSDRQQTDEWLWLHWQTLRPDVRAELVRAYLAATKQVQS